jgi:hypothetical protein
MRKEAKTFMHPVLSAYLAERRWPTDRRKRMVRGLRVLQEIARTTDRPITYGEFAERVQPGYAPIGTGAILGDIGYFCNAAGWPNVTCFVISATTGECSEGFTLVSDEDSAVARDNAWLAYAVYKTGPLVDEPSD